MSGTILPSECYLLHIVHSDGTIDKLCTRIPGCVSYYRISPSPPYHLLIIDSVARAISNFLNDPSIHTALGADKPFSQCDPSIKHRFWAENLEMMFPTQYYIAALLERGVRVLVYAGSNDWVCNWVCSSRDRDSFYKECLLVS